MKNIFTLLLAALIVSCSGDKSKSIEDVIASNDLELIRTKKAELDASSQELAKQIKQLETAIKTIDPQEKIPLISTYQIKNEVFTHYVELQGSVSTKQNIVIYPEFSGVLSTINVKEGQYVTKGQILGRINDGGLSQQLSQLKIQAGLAKNTFDRQNRLWEQKIGSEMQYLQAKASYEAQQEAVNQVQSQVNKTIIRAPFSGTIDDVITNQGSLVSPQTPAFRIINLKNMYIETDVPERYISEVVTDKKVLVDFPILGKQIEAKIRQAGNFINPANRTFKVEVGIDNKDQLIKPNLTAKLKINDYTNDKAILIPQSIISENAKGEQYVYAISNKSKNTGIAKRVIIKTGKTQGDLIEVISGLKDGNEIINEGARSVKDNQKVKILSY